jgi:hypothetical protein
VAERGLPVTVVAVGALADQNPEDDVLIEGKARLGSPRLLAVSNSNSA